MVGVDGGVSTDSKVTGCIGEKYSHLVVIDSLLLG